jgi:D-sedoheptulose 7-phosphate isomerase
MHIKFSVNHYFDAIVHLFSGLNIDAFEVGIKIVKEAFEHNKKVITCGNGGSAFTASHYITDWNKMINLATGKKFRGVSLSDNIGLLTAFGNDLSYNDVFSGQLEALMDDGDLLVAISGSGNSPNVLQAVETAKRMGGKTLAVVGYDGGKLMPLCDHSVWVQSYDMQLCEDVHLMFGHMVMKELCSTDILYS